MVVLELGMAGPALKCHQGRWKMLPSSMLLPGESMSLNSLEGPGRFAEPLDLTELLCPEAAGGVVRRKAVNIPTLAAVTNTGICGELGNARSLALFKGHILGFVGVAALHFSNPVCYPVEKRCIRIGDG